MDDEPLTNSSKINKNMFNRKCASNAIGKVLNSRIPKLLDEVGTQYRHAAVLIPLFEDRGVCHVLFTKRAEDLEHHKGQVSFPGGAVEPEDDSFQEAALREAHEEVGLMKQHVEVLGRIDDAMTLVSRFVVHPFVGHIPHPYDFVINGAEVERLVRVPLSVFFRENARYRKSSVEVNGITYQSRVYQYRGDRIWGATARMMENLMDILDYDLSLPDEEK